MLVFVQGAAAEQVRTASFPWEGAWRAGPPGTGAPPPERLASAVEQVMQSAGEDWMFLAAVDSSSGSVIGTAADLARAGEPGEGAPPEAGHAQARSPGRLAVLVFARGLAAEQVRTAPLPWDGSWEPESAGSRAAPPARLASAVSDVLRSVGEGWAFLAALDSVDGAVVGRAVDLGKGIASLAGSMPGGGPAQESPQGAEGAA